MPARTPTGRVTHTRQLYDTLLESYRDKPRGHTAAARHAGCARGTAEQAYFRGWPELTWAKPIKDRLFEETDEAAVARRERIRAQEARQAEEDAQREKARAERVRTLQDELNLQNAVRRTVLQEASVHLALNPAMAQLVRRVMRAVMDETVVDGQPKYTPKDPAAIDAAIPVGLAMKLISSWINAGSRVTLQHSEVIQLGRETRGPDDVSAGLPEMSEEEALDELAAAAAIYKAIQERDAADVAAREAEDAGKPPPGTTTH